MAIGRVNAPLGDYFKGDRVNAKSVTPVRDVPLYVSDDTPIKQTDVVEETKYVFNDDENIYAISKNLIQVFDKDSFNKKNETKIQIPHGAWHHHLTNRIYLKIFTPWDGYSLAIFDTKSYKYKLVFDSENDPLKRDGVSFTADKNGYTYFFAGDKTTTTLVIFDSNFYERGRFEYDGYNGWVIYPYCINDGYIYINGGKINIQKPSEMLPSHEYNWVCTSPSQDAVAYGGVNDIKKQGKKGNWAIRFPHNAGGAGHVSRVSMNENEEVFLVNDLGFKFLGGYGELEGVFSGRVITADNQYIYILHEWSDKIEKYKHGKVTEYILNKD